MKSFTLLITTATLALTVLATPSLYGGDLHARAHHDQLAKRAAILQAETRELYDAKAQIVQRKAKRSQCKLAGTTLTGAGATSFSVAAATTSDVPTTSTFAAPTSSAVQASSSAEASSSAQASSSSVKATSSSSSAPAQSSSSGSHLVTLTNKCSTAVQPAVADTKCGFSPRCDGASSYTAAQPGSLAPGATESIFLPEAWVGRIYADTSKCGASGADCTMLEFNLDTGNMFTPQAYDISNIQGFTQSIQLSAAGCDTVTCTSADCSCEDAYPVGDMTGCGSDLPVKACGAGNISFDVVFCP